MYNTGLEMVNDISNLKNFNFKSISDIFLNNSKRQYITGLLLLLFGLVIFAIGSNY
jgi:hypothetical protein